MDEREALRALRPAMRQVHDPVSDTSVWLAGLVQGARVHEGALHFDLVVTDRYDERMRRGLVDALVGALKGAGVTLPVVPRVVEREDGAPAAKKTDVPEPAPSLPGVGQVIAVASGKGGVGKSTVASNLAVGLARQGLAVGLLDADIYGPSAPTMLGVHGKPLVSPQGKILPAQAHGVKVLSMGLVVDADTPMIWRGPMVMGAIRQFLDDAQWAPLDVLVVDMPPGTGDAQLTLMQSVKLAGAVVVTTPQTVALADAIRGIQMFRQLDVPLLGIVENMAYYPLPDGTRDYVFGQGGGVRTAELYDTEVLGVLPLATTVRCGADEGVPVVLQDVPEAGAYVALVEAVRAKLTA